MSTPGGLLLVHAHPDDECFSTGGVIARAIAEGRRVDLVVCTGGEEGEVHDPDLDPDEARPRMREIRAAELECSLAELGGGSDALHLHRLGYRDSGMKDSEANANPAAFWQADMDEATGRAVSVIRAAKPAVLVTYDANGNYGHPDHINAHRVAVAAFLAAADPSRYPDAGPAWAVAKFYETAFDRERWSAVMQEMTQRGIKLPWDQDTDDAADEPKTDVEEESGFGIATADITTFVDVAEYAAPKRAAMACHRTQRQDFGWFLDLPDDLAERISSPESFVLTRWPGHDIAVGLQEAWLFDGLEAD